MKYDYKVWTIENLLDLYNNHKLELNPPYQRNDIWPPISKKRLIDSIKRGFPLPTFFLHKKENDQYDMVDGQQRTRTFLGYQKGFFPDINKLKYNKETDDTLYKDYKISVCLLITNEDEKGSVEDFYYRVNKFGIKLNRPEIKRAEFSGSEFQELIERLSKSTSFSQLALFSEKSKERLNDQDFVAELLTLIKYGITDKKITVDKLYEVATEDDLGKTETLFNNTIQRICDLDAVFPLSQTRYRQRNDFYTLFNFILKHNEILTDDILVYHYKSLVLIGGDIYPTNEKCWSFQNYAINCVSQSNSKKSRMDRLLFFEHLLLNKEPEPISKLIPEETTDFDVIADVLKYYQIESQPLINIEGFYLVNIDALIGLKNISF